MKRAIVLILAVLVWAPAARGVPCTNLPPPVRRTPLEGRGNTSIPRSRAGRPTLDPGGSPFTGGSTRPRTRPSGTVLDSSWELWWDLNREHLLGTGQIAKRTARREGTSADPLLYARLKVRTSLRKVARVDSDDRVRAAAIRALGRVGNDADVERFLALLSSSGQPDRVLEAAAIALGSVPTVRSPELRAAVRDFLQGVLSGKRSLPPRARLLAVLATGLRGRDDAALVRSLGTKLREKLDGMDEAAAVLLACGLTKDSALSPEIETGVATGRLGRTKIGDVARGHAAIALAMLGEPSSAKTLAATLGSKNVQIHTRRSAALALGIILRTPGLDDELRAGSERALTRARENFPDTLVRAYCVMGMGVAAEPFGITALMSTVAGGGQPVVRPFAALSLGFAARKLPAEAAKKIRKFLLTQLAGAKNQQLGAALSLAVGLAGGEEGVELLLKRVSKRNLSAMRGPACQGLGLMALRRPEIDKALLRSFGDPSDMVVEDAAIGLGFLRHPESGPLLFEKLRGTRSEMVQRHMVVALVQLGDSATIDPLVELLMDRERKHTIRESAATTLGILLSKRSRDPLFEIDASCYPYGLTEATRELVFVY